jgi:hypothetical protein
MQNILIISIYYIYVNIQSERTKDLEGKLIAPNECINLKLQWHSKAIRGGFPHPLVLVFNRLILNLVSSQFKFLFLVCTHIS